MALTFQEAKDKCVTYLDDVNYGYFTDAIVSRYINDAQFELQKKLISAGVNYYVKAVYTTMVPGQKDYALPEDLLKINRLEYVVQNFNQPNEVSETISPVTLNQQDTYPLNSGNPRGYYLTKAKLWTIPAPDNVYQLKLHYTYRVVPCTLAGQTMDCPEEFMEFIPILAALDGFIRDGRDPTPLLSKKAFYESMLEKEAQRRTVDKPRMIVDTSESFGVLF